MEKKPAPRKLTLNRETVRKLTENELTQVAGGTGSLAGCHFSRASGCCPCTGTSNPPTSPSMCPTE